MAKHDWPAHDNIIIAPTLRDVPTISSWLKRNEVRGIWDNEDTLVLFDSYGNTHDSVRRALGLRMLNGDCIVQKDGNIHTGDDHGGKKHKLEYCFSPEECKLFRALAKMVGNDNPYVKGYE